MEIQGDRDQPKTATDDGVRRPGIAQRDDTQEAETRGDQQDPAHEPDEAAKERDWSAEVEAIDQPGAAERPGPPTKPRRERHGGPIRDGS